MIRVLVADDSILFRRIMAEVLASLPNVEIIGKAINGKIAVEKVLQLQPDLLTLDMEMPEMNGLAVLKALKEKKNNTAVIVVSSLTKKGGALTIKALSSGAFDFITKPEAKNAKLSQEALKNELAPRIKALELRLDIRNALKTSTTAPAAPYQTKSQSFAKAEEELADSSLTTSSLLPLTKPEMVLIGVSTGGPNALTEVLPLLPATLNVPVLVVQHMPPIFTQSLAESLNGKCQMKVCEASDKEPVLPNQIYIAPGGKQMRLETDKNGNKFIKITNDPPENNCRPSVDYLFRSAANLLPGKTTAVILTGMGNDGTLGLKLLKRRGCFVIAQDEKSCVVFGMPKSAIQANVVDFIMPLDGVANKIISVVRGNF